jgi:predicted transcriptional regulator
MLSIGDGAAMLAFASRDGRMDMNYSFFGTDARFLGFCRDYFESVWSQAKPVAEAMVRASIKPQP